ncbi:MAG: hypothetical protein WKH97_14900 [Casimicrobiaceae bacterium]
MPAENQLTLDVTVFARGEIRHKPAGITAIAARCATSPCKSKRAASGGM